MAAFRGCIMLQNFFSTFLSRPSNDPQGSSRRIHDRRETDRCICTMHGRNFPVENWSFGGALIDADERLFAVGQAVDMTFKFKLRSAILDVNIRGTVIRKNTGKLGIKFEPVSQTIRRHFQQVVDDQVAREFANSQA